MKSIHELIEKENTGTSKVFSEKLGISRSILMEHLREFREDFNAPVFYCRKRQTFYYGHTYRLSILIQDEMEGVKGGQETFGYFAESESTGLNSLSFDLLYLQPSMPKYVNE